MTKVNFIQCTASITPKEYAKPIITQSLPFKPLYVPRLQRVHDGAPMPRKNNVSLRCRTAEKEYKIKSTFFG